MVNLAKIGKVFDKYQNQQINNASLDYIIKDIKKFASDDEISVVEEIIGDYKDATKLQINNFFLKGIYDEIEESILLSYEFSEY